MEVILSCFLGQPCVIIKEVSFENALPCIITIVVNPGSYTFLFFLPPLTVTWNLYLFSDGVKM